MWPGAGPPAVAFQRPAGPINAYHFGTSRETEDAPIEKQPSVEQQAESMTHQQLLEKKDAELRLREEQIRQQQEELMQQQEELQQKREQLEKTREEYMKVEKTKLEQLERERLEMRRREVFWQQRVQEQEKHFSNVRNELKMKEMEMRCSVALIDHREIRVSERELALSCMELNLQRSKEFAAEVKQEKESDSISKCSTLNNEILAAPLPASCSVDAVSHQRVQEQETHFSNVRKELKKKEMEIRCRAKLIEHREIRVSERELALSCMELKLQRSQQFAAEVKQEKEIESISSVSTLNDEVHATPLSTSCGVNVDDGNLSCVESQSFVEKPDGSQCDTPQTQSTDAVKELRDLIEAMSQDIVRISKDQRIHLTSNQLSMTDAQKKEYAEKMADFEACQDAAIKKHQEVMEHLQSR